MHELDDLVLQPWLVSRPGPADFDPVCVDEWKLSLLAEALPAAMALHAPSPQADLDLCHLLIRSDDSHAKLQATGPLHRLAATLSADLMRRGERAGSLAWGRVSYIAARQVNHAWLDFFDVMRACGAIESVDLAGIDRNSLTLPAVPPRLVQYRPEDPHHGAADRQISWFRHNPEIEYRALDDAAAAGILRTRFGPRVHAAYGHAATASHKAAIVALTSLMQHGGVYADRNEVCRASLDVLLGADCDFLMPWRLGRPSVFLPQFIASRSANPLLGRLLKHLVRGSEWMRMTGNAIDEWMIAGAGAFTMTILDEWCERGAWPDAGHLRVLDHEHYRAVVDTSDQDGRRLLDHGRDQPPQVPAIPTIGVDQIIMPEESVFQAAGEPPQRALPMLADRLLPAGRELAIISVDSANLVWQERQAKPVLAPAAGVYWLSEIGLSGHGCLWKGNDFIQLGSYLSDVAEGETRGGAWQTPWTHKVVRVIEEPVVVAFSPGYSCYGHWLVDELPRIGLLKRALGASFATTKFIFPEKIRSWGKSLLKFFFDIGDDQIIYFNHEREMWRLKSAIVPTFLHRHYDFQPFVREFFSGFAPEDCRPHRRVCLSRRDWDQSKPDQRIFVQREMFERMAVDRGYEVFAPEELSLADQVRLMAETSVQIGEHGSAQYGSIFSRHSTIVGSINPLTGVQVNLGRVADDRNVLLFPDEMQRDANGSLRFACSAESLVRFFDAIERIEAG